MKYDSPPIGHSKDGVQESHDMTLSQQAIEQSSERSIVDRRAVIPSKKKKRELTILFYWKRTGEMDRDLSPKMMAIADRKRVERVLSSSLVVNGRRASSASLVAMVTEHLNHNVKNGQRMKCKHKRVSCTGSLGHTLRTREK